MHNYDYRLAFLLMTLPQLLTWTRIHASPVPAPRSTLVVVLAVLWLSEPISSKGLYFDELLTWLSFVNLATALAVLTWVEVQGLLQRSPSTAERSPSGTAAVPRR